MKNPYKYLAIFFNLILGFCLFSFYNPISQLSLNYDDIDITISNESEMDYDFLLLPRNEYIATEILPFDEIEDKTGNIGRNGKQILSLHPNFNSEYYILIGKQNNFEAYDMPAEEYIVVNNLNQLQQPIDVSKYEGIINILKKYLGVRVFIVLGLILLCLITFFFRYRFGLKSDWIEILFTMTTLILIVLNVIIVSSYIKFLFAIVHI